MRGSAARLDTARRQRRQRRRAAETRLCSLDGRVPLLLAAWRSARVRRPHLGPQAIHAPCDARAYRWHLHFHNLAPRQYSSTELISPPATAWLTEGSAADLYRAYVHEMLRRIWRKPANWRFHLLCALIELVQPSAIAVFADPCVFGAQIDWTRRLAHALRRQRARGSAAHHERLRTLLRALDPDWRGFPGHPCWLVRHVLGFGPAAEHADYVCAVATAPPGSSSWLVMRELIRNTPGTLEALRARWARGMPPAARRLLGPIVNG